MKRKGFTLIEITISTALILFVLSSAYSLLSSAIKTNSNFLAEKELTETASLLQSYLVTDMERSESIDQVLDRSGKIHEHIGETPIDTICIKLGRSRNIMYQKSYINQLIFLKKDDRKSVWVFKNSRNDLALDIANYRLYSGSYEVGTHVDSLFISQIDQGIYKIELNLKYYQTEFEHKSNFLVKLQE